MTRSAALSALTFSAILALGASTTAFAAPANTGGAAQAADFVASTPMVVTRGSVLVAEQKGGGSQASGNPLASQAPIAHYMVGDDALSNRGNGAVDSNTVNSFSNGAQG